MDAAVESMSIELADELAANNRRLIVDSRMLPARFHNLKAMAQSAQHCLASFEDKGELSLAIRIGAGTHAKMFGKPCVRFEGKVRRGKEWDAFKTLNAEAAILNRKEWSRADAICDSIKRHALASRLLFGPGTIHEQTILWEQRGRARRSTPDVRGPHHVVELKTARCAEPAKFTRDATYRAYHAQLADQCQAVKYLTGTAPREAYIVAIESVPPYAITVLQLTERALEKGAALCSQWLERLITAETTGLWPPYSTGVEVFDVPDLDFDMDFSEPEDPDWVKGSEP